MILKKILIDLSKEPLSVHVAVVHSNGIGREGSFKLSDAVLAKAAELKELLVAEFHASELAPVQLPPVG